MRKVDTFVKSKVIYGTNRVSEGMKRFVIRKFRNRYIFNKRILVERLKLASKLLKEKRVLIHAPKNFEDIVKKFAEKISAKYYVGRFLPGTLTNPRIEEYYEADILFVLDPEFSKIAIKEASKANVPVIAICNSHNTTSRIDFVIPGNNKIKSSIEFILGEVV